MVHERLPDPILLDAFLINQKSNVGGSSSPPSSIATPQRNVNLHPLTKEIQARELPQSEAEQLVGQELIKTLDNFKQIVAASLSPRQNSSS
jgi:hypothetical protein